MKILNLHSIFFFFILIEFVSKIYSASSKKKDLDHFRKINRPSNISDELYCYSCLIPSKTIVKRIKSHYKDLEILDLVTESCKQQKGFFNRFNEKFKASLLKDACEAFITNWEDLLVKNTKKMQKNNKISEFSDMFCVELTQACKKGDSNLEEVKIDYEFISKRIEDL